MVFDITPGDIVNSDDVAAMQTAQDSVNQAAAEAIANPDVAPALEVMSGIDSSAVESVLGLVQDAKAAPAVQVQGQAVVEASNEPPQEKPLTPYQKRVQNLIREREEVKRVAQQQAQQLQQMQLELQRQKDAQVQSVLDMQRKQLEAAERVNAQREEAALPEHERVKKQFEREVVAQAKRELAPELQAYKQELEQLKVERQKALEEAEKQRRFQYFTQQGKQVLETKLLAGFDPQDAKAIAPQLEEMLYAYCGAYGLEPVQAAPHFEKFIATAFQAYAKRLQRTAGAKVAQSRAAPAPLPTGHAGGSVAAAMPTMAELRAAGFDNHPQWIARGRPPIKRG